MFHQYIYGKEIVPFTDHKSLEAIFKKPITSTPKKLQRILLALQPYRLTKLYEPGWDENKNLSNLLRKPEENLVIFVFQGRRHRVDFYKMVSDRLYTFTHLRILYQKFFILKHLRAPILRTWIHIIYIKLFVLFYKWNCVGGGIAQWKSIDLRVRIWVHPKILNIVFCGVFCLTLLKPNFFRQHRHLIAVEKHMSNAQGTKGGLCKPNRLRDPRMLFSVILSHVLPYMSFLTTHSLCQCYVMWGVLVTLIIIQIYLRHGSYSGIRFYISTISSVYV